MSCPRDFLSDNPYDCSTTKLQESLVELKALANVYEAGQIRG